jgi:hypothetical protein
VIRVGPLLRYEPLVLVAAFCLVIASLDGRGALAIFGDQASNSGNTFTTIPTFPVDTGWLDPSAQAADTGGDGDGFELNPDYAFGDGPLSALNQDGPGDRHRYYNYGVSLPGGSSVFGIEVRLDWWLDDTTGNTSLGIELSSDGGTSWTSAKTDTQETTGEHTGVLGARNDTWGRTWTLPELSDANFRVRVICNSSESGRDFYLEWIPIKIHYIPP